MLKVGLTGGIGSGKTTVSNLFTELGVPVIDTDVIARELVDDKHVLAEIVNFFGKAILDHNNKLDRTILAKLVFDTAENKQKLEDILHPKIRITVNEKTHQLVTSNYPPPYTIIVIPLLIETNFNQIIDRTLVVIADEENRVERIKQRDNRNMDEIRAIISAQTTDRKRLNSADDIIENNSNINELNIKTQILHKKYRAIAGTIK